MAAVKEATGLLDKLKASVNVPSHPYTANTTWDLSLAPSRLVPVHMHAN